ncbi:uncharacterized protein LOC126973896 [Leptidea sinapis]|uniref:uncharacterized protein LOC126973896 n=1 Tax=Leptidea sinapis TaxID=189913 RepID=UPI0021C3EB80|nr:uncharacterized protein LOC126973896 [Leptidea sinapis]
MGKPLGESLPESCSLEQRSGCPTYSGEGESRCYMKSTTLTKPALQQVFHKGLIINKTRSNSFSESANNSHYLVKANPPIDPTESTSQEASWTESTNRKRLRNSPDAQTRTLKQTKLNYWLVAPVTTSNRFDLLDDESQITANPAPKPIRPPPIFVDKVSNMQPLSKMLEEVASNDYVIKVLQGERVKIQSKSSDTYCLIYKELKKRNTEFFTYQPKQNRSFRVVLKHMHPSTDTDDLKAALEELNLSNLSWMFQMSNI